MAAIYRGRTSCPSNCPIYKICYANAGPGGSMFNKVEKFGSDDNLVLMKLTCIPPNGALRVNVSGDYFIDDQADLEYIEYLNFFANLRPDVSIISYTHSWRTFTPRNFAYVVNASVETAQDAASAINAGWNVALVDDGSLIGKYINGRKVVLCPAQAVESVTCNTCRLCAKDRKSIVAFLIHGVAKKKMYAKLEELRYGA